MIGSRILVAAVAVTLIAVLGGGAPRPEVGRAANAAVSDAADRALAAIDLLQQRLALAVDRARAGAARVVAGAEDPGEPLAAAGDRVLDASPEALVLREALVTLVRAREAVRPGAEALPPSPGAGELESISAQLGGAAELGAEFAETRRSAEGVSVGLVDALDAVAAGESDEAHEQLLIGLTAVEGLRAWEDDAPALTVWIDTADAMIRAMQRLVDAVRANDPEDAEAAQADFAAAAEDAPMADRALRIGLDEAASTVTAVPLGRLSDVLVMLDELERAVRAVAAGARP